MHKPGSTVTRTLSGNVLRERFYDAIYHLTLFNARHFAKQGGENWVESTLVPTLQAPLVPTRRGGGGGGGGLWADWNEQNFKKNLSLTEKFGNGATKIQKLNSKYIYSIKIACPISQMRDTNFPHWNLSFKLKQHVSLVACNLGIE